MRIQTNEPFFPGPTKRIPRYCLLANECQRQMPASVLAGTIVDELSESFRWNLMNPVPCALDIEECRRVFSSNYNFSQPNISIGRISSISLNYKLPVVRFFFDKIYEGDVHVVKWFLAMNIVNPNATLIWKPRATTNAFFQVSDRYCQGTTGLFIATAVEN